jgi:beta-glucosidase
VLTGVAEPAGRLPLTLPVHIGQTPAADAHTYPGVDGRVEYAEGVLVGYRGFDAAGIDPAYPFGHGLGYTEFEYSGLEVTATGSDPDGGDAVAEVSVTVRNVGGREGTEVVQVYVGELPTEVVTPPRQLAAFAKVPLAVGEESRVTLRVPRRSVSYFDVAAHDWVAPAGEVAVHVGASSRDIRLTGAVTVR